MQIKFLPEDKSVEVAADTKLLVAARQAKVSIVFGCASCRCGTCAVEVRQGQLSEPKEDERDLLGNMKLPLDGSIRLACQARTTSSDVEIDLSFQSKYSPDKGIL